MALISTAITPKIVKISAASQAELNRTFMRFQEHYESPEWRGKVFTIGQFRRWYSETNGADTYESDWSGFNVPSKVLTPFREGLFDPLTELEQEFLSLFRYRGDEFYIIGTQSDKPDTLEHEICHGLYFTEPTYKAKVNCATQPYWDSLTDLKSMILEDYHDSVLVDEVHAYISANFKWLQEKRGIKVPAELHQKLREIRKEFSTPGFDDYIEP